MRDGSVGIGGNIGRAHPGSPGAMMCRQRLVFPRQGHEGPMVVSS